MGAIIKLQNIARRALLKKGAYFGAAYSGARLFSLVDQVLAAAPKAADARSNKAPALPDLVAVKNREPDVLFDAAIAAMGSMSRFVKKGQTVAVKPNMSWESGPEAGANTHPVLVRRIIEHCFQAGAKKVYAFDHTFTRVENSYSTSGIAQAVKEAGGTLAPANNPRYYHPVDIQGANSLLRPKVHELYLDADVFINVPVLKTHIAGRITCAMKNLMGVVWDRMEYHHKGLHRCIYEFCLFRKPDLNVVDAYRIMMRNGPAAARREDMAMNKMLLLSPDIVAADAASATILGINPEDVLHITYGHRGRLGNMHLNELRIIKMLL